LSPTPKLNISGLGSFSSSASTSGTGTPLISGSSNPTTSANISSIGVLYNGGFSSIVGNIYLQPRLTNPLDNPDIVNFTLFLNKEESFTSYISKTKSMDGLIDKSLAISSYIDKQSGVDSYIDKQVEKTLTRER
tara:strand:- start:3657 stop:4058 length:402 start_codon:yes stop_codon:yes gene_type:complete